MGPESLQSVLIEYPNGRPTADSVENVVERHTPPAQPDKFSENVTSSDVSVVLPDRFLGVRLREPITHITHANFIARRDNRPVITSRAVRDWLHSEELKAWLATPRPHLSVALTDAGGCKDGYLRGSNPRFDHLPWFVDEPMVASDWVRDVPNNADTLLSDWRAKYSKQHTEVKDPNIERQDPIFIKPKPQKAENVPGPNKTPSWITIIDARHTFLKPAGLSKWTMIVVADGTPEHRTPGEDCFSEPPRPREDVGWRIEGRDENARLVPEIPGGRGGAGAKLQIAEEDFVPAELAAESETRWWEDRINKSITDFAEQHPGELQPIVRQDRNGNLVGQHFNLIKRTTISEPKRQQEMDARMAEIRRRKAAGETGEKIRLDELAMTTYFDRTLAEAGKLVGKGKEAMKKRRQRIVPKEMSEQEYDDMLWKAVRATYPTIEDERPGWHALIKLERRPPYYYKLDVPARAAESEIDDAVNRAARAETIRIAAAEADRVGLKKLSKEDGKLNDAGLKVLRDTRARVFKAFEEAEIHDLSFKDCRTEPCESCLPQSCPHLPLQ
jgi:hypothetical protein